MVKHAFLIIAHNKFLVLGKSLALLDDENCTFFIHIDKKVDEHPETYLKSCCKKSKIHFIERMNVHWGGYSLIDCTLRLLEVALLYDFEYYHLLSGVDLPIKKKEYILSYFERHPMTQFVQCSVDIKPNYLERLRFHSLFQDSDYSFLRMIDKIIRTIERIVGFSRIKDESCDFRYGSNWFSITGDFARWIIENKSWINKVFYNTYIGDELFVQTMLVNSPFIKQASSNMCNGEPDNLRYIDFNRGKPYVFKESDFDELMATPALFARKFDPNEDEKIIEKIYETLK